MRASRGSVSRRISLGAMADEAGSDDNLCFFITRIGEEGSPEREQADGVLDAIGKPAAGSSASCARAGRSRTLDTIATRSTERLKELCGA